MSATLTQICEHVAAGRVRISQHGLQELMDDGIDLQAIISGLGGGIVIEDYPDYFKGPCVLCLQNDADGRPVHVLWGIAAKTPNVATVITAYRPDPARWHEDWVTRRPK